MTWRIGLAHLLLMVAAAAQGVPRSWRLIDSASSASPEGQAVLLERADIAAAGWRIKATGTQQPLAGDALSRAGDRITCRLDHATLIVIDGAPDTHRLTLDDRFEISGVSAWWKHKGAEAQETALLLPPGLHVVTVHPPTGWTPLIRFYGLTIGPLLGFALLFAWLNRFGGSLDPRPARTGRRGAGALLALLVMLSWSWVLDLPLLAVDHDHVHVFPKLLVGDDPFGPTGPTDHRDRPVADGDVFRPWQYLLHGLITIASGGSSLWLHFFGVLMHGGCAVVLYRLLARLVPRGAWLGALVGSTLPLYAQSLTWVNAHALPQCLLAGFTAWLCAVRYLEVGLRRDLVCVPVLLWIASTTKESGLTMVMALPVVAPLIARRLAWRRIGLLALAAVLLLVGWRAARGASGIPFSLETYGMTFDSSLDVLIHAVRRLPGLLEQSTHITVMTDVSEAGIDATAALASDESAAGIRFMRTAGSWLPHPAIWWSLLGILATIGITFGTRTQRIALLLGLPLCLAMALPDALHHAPTPALIRKVHPLVLPGLALIAAGAAQGLGTSSRRRRVGLVIGAIVAGLFFVGHAREATVWHAFGQVPSAWVHEVRETCEAMDARPAPEEPLGPPAVVIVGMPPQFGFDSLLGPTMAGYQQPPNTTRAWTGDHLRNREVASDLVRSWPWEIVVIESDGSVAAPMLREVLPASVTGPLTLQVESTGDRFTIASPAPWRAADGIALRWKEALPPGTSVTVGRTTTTLTRGHAAGADFRMTLSELGTSALDPGPILIEGKVSTGTPTPSEASALREIPEIVWQSPSPASEIPHGAVLPELAWRLPLERPDAFIMKIAADGAEFAAHVPPLELRIPEGLLERAGDVWSSTILRTNTAAWERTLHNIRASRPDVAAFWIRISIRAVIGVDGTTLAASRPLLLRIRLRPR